MRLWVDNELTRTVDGQRQREGNSKEKKSTRKGDRECVHFTATNLDTTLLVVLYCHPIYETEPKKLSHSVRSECDGTPPVPIVERAIHKN